MHHFGGICKNPQYAWAASLFAVKLVPLILVAGLTYWLFLGLRHHLQRKHEVERMRATRPIPEAVTHYTAPRLNLNYGSRGLSDAHSLPALEDQLRILDLHQWFPMVTQHPAHILLLGETGSGKSLHAQALLTERAHTDRIVVLDPHANLNDWRGIRTYGDGRNFDEIEQMIYAIHAEFERRFKPGADVGDPITIFVDEVPALADEKKGTIPIITKWLREARKTGIRLVMLSQGWEVKSLGLQGEGSVRESLLFLRLGSFALDVADIPPYVQYPAVLLRGTGKEEPLILDTTGLPNLIRDVPPVAVWQPPTSTSSNEVLILPERTPSGKKKQRFSDAQIAEIHARKAVGESKTRACREMFGTTGGNTWYAFQEVWDSVAIEEAC